MENEICNKAPLDGLEIVTVRNGWIVYLGGGDAAGMMYRDGGFARVRYVFQSAEELGRAVPELLLTGRYEVLKPCAPLDVGASTPSDIF